MNVFYSDEPYSVDDYISDTEIIAHISIGNWIEWVDKKESLLDRGAKYEAEVLEVYKGELLEKIIFMQSASSEIADYPWYTHGNELLVFIKYNSDEDYYRGAAYDIAEYENGALYVLAPEANSMAWEIEAVVSGRGIMPTAHIIECKAKEDPYWSEIPAEIMTCFKLSDFEKYVKDK